MQKIIDSKVFIPKWNVHKILFLQGLKDHPWRVIEKTVKARSRSIFQTKQRSCIQEFTVLVIGCTNPFKCKSDKILVWSWERRHKNPTASWRVIDAFSICWVRRNLSCSAVTLDMSQDSRKCPSTPGQVPLPRLLGKYKLYSMSEEIKLRLVLVGMEVWEGWVWQGLRELGEYEQNKL